MLKRLFRHLFTTNAATRRAFPPDALDAITAAITRGEATHRAEVRMIIETALPAAAVLDRLSPRERALELFGRYRIWDTEENSGVLVYINLADRQVEIIADRSIAAKTGPDEWQRICSLMTTGFGEGRFHESALAALAAINALLAENFPTSGEKTGQLPDQPLLI